MRNGRSLLQLRTIAQSSFCSQLLRRAFKHASLPLAPFIQTPQCRGAKTKTTVRIDDPTRDAPAQAKALPKAQNGPIFPTVIQQARENMHKYSSCVLLTRVGSFYELYFSQAQHYGPLLNLKVASKVTAAGDVPMAGFPFYQLDRFLKVLVQDYGEHVAISEEFANDASNKVKSGGLLFDRRVARVVTPGTLIDENFLVGEENNYLLAVHVEAGNAGEAASTDEAQTAGSGPTLKASVGLAWLDLSTGEFFTQKSSLGQLPSEVSRIGAREVIMLGNGLGRGQFMKDWLQQQNISVSEHSLDLGSASIDSWNPMLQGSISPDIQPAFTRDEIFAGQILLSYTQDRVKGTEMKLQPPIRRHDREFMSIDTNSMKALEVLSTSKDGYGKGSLLHTLRRTVTRSGARLLRDWVSSPSMSIQTISARLDLVSALMTNRSMAEQTIALLKRSYDSQRLIQKFSLGRGDADDLVSLAKTIEVAQGIADLLQQETSAFENVSQTPETTQQRHSLLRLQRRLSLDGPMVLADVIRSSIDEDGLMESHRIAEDEGGDLVAMAQEVLESRGSPQDRTALQQVTKSKSKIKSANEQDGEDQKPWILCQSASHVLQELHTQLDELRQEKSALTERLRQERNAQSLTLRWTPGLGHICHIKGKVDSRSSQSNTRLLKATKSTTSLHDPAWSKLGGKIDQARLRIRAEEHSVLQDLRSQVIMNLIKLRRNATVLDELDIGCSFASLAEEQNLVRPSLNEGYEHRIIGGRHPTVMQGLEEQGRAFVSNDCHVGGDERIWLITGPNMAGKSTFLRQNALISIMAQAGSFVPADSAQIGLVDQIFTRVGSADNLFKDQSTFMVEMIETAAILKQATPRSFVIMDEIGRGTTPEDGVAVGYACLHHLYHTNCCRTLFATHFHGLANMTKDFQHLACYCTDIVEGSAGSFSFVHRLRQGVNRSSHALKVAALAGVPQAAIDTARAVLESIRLGQATELHEKALQAAATAA